VSGGLGSEQLGNMLILSGLITGVIGIAVFAVVGEIWALIIVVVAISDLGIGALFRSGLLGRSTSGGSDLRTEFPSEPDVDPTAADDAFGVSSTENPYARED